jgi:hypothetical protein
MVCLKVNLRKINNCLWKFTYRGLICKISTSKHSVDRPVKYWVGLHLNSEHFFFHFFYFRNNWWLVSWYIEFNCFLVYVRVFVQQKQCSCDFLGRTCYVKIVTGVIFVALYVSWLNLDVVVSIACPMLWGLSLVASFVSFVYIIQFFMSVISVHVWILRAHLEFACA